MLATAACCFTAPADAQQKPDADKTRDLMRRKLDCSQKLLEALVLNDLAGAARQTEEMLRIRKDPAFRVFKTAEYELWSNEFAGTADAILRAAKENNLEAAKLQYLGMTMSCFHCHTYTRDMRNTQPK